MRQIRAAKEIGATMIEFHTGRYAEAKKEKDIKKEFEVLKKSSHFAKEEGFQIFAGHGLNYKNTAPLKRITEIEEYNIGHAIIARAVFVGLEKAVREMKELIK